jgi:hypothetical protein
MIDIIGASATGLDVLSTDVNRAANILSVQLGALEYAPTLGIDLNFFLTSQFNFENESFQSYLVETLANAGINVSTVLEVVGNLSNQLIFSVQGEDQSSSLIAE